MSLSSSSPSHGGPNAVADECIVTDPAVAHAFAPMFEGPEKRLQINVSLPSRGSATLRTAISRPEWDETLTLARCEVISVLSNEHYDSYILSESSLFVSNSEIMIKTCGTTTLLHCLAHLLHLLRQRGFVPTFISYSRRKYFFPDQQVAPHASFPDEVAHLRELLATPDDDADLAHYQFGQQDQDHWCIFVASLAGECSDRSSCGSEDDDVVSGLLDAHGSAKASAEEQDDSPKAGEPATAAQASSVHDVTLEVMMRDLDRDVMQRFYQNHALFASTKSARHVTHHVGIADLMRGARIDEHMFDPCGYSLNALRNDAYWTIHITPEPECSYVSFETNVRLADYTDLVRDVLQTFAPRVATVALTCSTRVHDDVRTMLTPAKDLPHNMRLDWAQGKAHRRSHSIGVWNLVHATGVSPQPSMVRRPASPAPIDVLH